MQVAAEGAWPPSGKRENETAESDRSGVTAGAADQSGEPDSGYWRLEDQIRWYDGKAIGAQNINKWMKWAQIVVAALIPVAALLFPRKAIVSRAPSAQ